MSFEDLRTTEGVLLTHDNNNNNNNKGAKIIRTQTDAPHDSDESNIGLAKKLLKEIPDSVMLDQYNNPASESKCRYRPAQC